MKKNYKSYHWAEIIEEPKVEVKEKIKSTITWKIGDYVVFVEDWSRSKKGNIDKIEKLGAGVIALYLEKEGLAGSPLYNDCKLKVFPTLQEAQKFSDELLGKSKTSLGVEDLVKGAIYCSLMSDKPQWESLHLYHGNGENMFKYRLYIHSSYKGNDKFDKSDWGKCTSNQYRLATSSEKKWLKTCIKQDKFIPQDQLDKYDDEGNLMESKEYPEYIELVKPKGYGISIKENGGTIFNINFTAKTPGTRTIKELYKDYPEDFKPSTREAYEAQFKKDEEFKVGDWVVVTERHDENSANVGDVVRLVTIDNSSIPYEVSDDGRYNYAFNPSWCKKVRKALPHEIPVENSVKQNPWVFEECKFPVDIEKFIIGTDPIVVKGTGVVLPANIKKTPDLIDKSKVEVKIKRTKVKQIKL